MDLVINNTNGAGNTQATRLGNFSDWTYLLIQVKTVSVSVFLFDNESDATAALIAGSAAGWQLTTVAAAGVEIQNAQATFQGWWRGPLYAIGSANGIALTVFSFTNPPKSILQNVFGNTGVAV